MDVIRSVVLDTPSTSYSAPWLSVGWSNRSSGASGSTDVTRGSSSAWRFRRRGPPRQSRMRSEELPGLPPTSLIASRPALPGEPSNWTITFSIVTVPGSGGAAEAADRERLGTTAISATTAVRFRQRRPPTICPCDPSRSCACTLGPRTVGGATPPVKGEFWLRYWESSALMSARNDRRLQRLTRPHPSVEPRSQLADRQMSRGPVAGAANLSRVGFDQAHSARDAVKTKVCPIVEDGKVGPQIRVEQPGSTLISVTSSGRRPT